MKGKIYICSVENLLPVHLSFNLVKKTFGSPLSKNNRRQSTFKSFVTLNVIYVFIITK